MSFHKVKQIVKIVYLIKDICEYAAAHQRSVKVIASCKLHEGGAWNKAGTIRDVSWDPARPLL